MLGRATVAGAVAMALSVWVIPAQAWVTTGTAGPTPKPLVLDPAGDPVTAVTESGRFIVKKLDADTGVELWATIVESDALQSGVLGVDAAGDVIASAELDCVFFPTSCTGGSAVVKLSGASGAVLWREDFAERATALPDPAGDVLVLRNVGTTSSQMMKLGGIAGATIWSSSSFSIYEAAWAADAAGNAFVAGRTPGQELGAARVAGATGAIDWQVALGVTGVALSVAVDSAGDVVVGGDGSMIGQVLFKLAAADGSSLWQVIGGGFGVSRVATDAADDVFVQSHVDVIKYAGATGAELWTFNGDSDFGLRADGDVITLGAFGRMRLLDGDSGVPVWEQQVLTGALGGQVYLTAVGEVVSGARAIFGTGNQGGDQPRNLVFGLASRLTGRALLVKDNPLDPSENQVVVQCKDPLFGPPSPTAEPADPTVNGAVLTLRNPATLESASIALPAAGWTAKVSGSRIGRYTYKFQSASPNCRALLKSPGKFKVKCKGTTGGFTLDEASQGSLAVELAIGAGGYVQCLEFGGEVIVDEPAGATRGLFKARNAPAAAACAGGF